MPKFYFEARDFEGKIKKGEREAKDIFELASSLKKEGLFLIRAKKEKKERKKTLSFSLFGVSLAEKIFFTRNLKVMISAGVSLTRALETLATQVKNSYFKKVLFEIRERIEKGEALSQALSFFPKIFPEIYQSMVKVGEEGGRLEEVLDTLAFQMERENELKSKIKGAMLYPAIVILAMIGVAALMLTFVVPKLAQTFEELKIELPATTKAVIFLGKFMEKNWPFLLLLLIFFFFLFSRALKTKLGKKIFDSILLKIPIISGIVKKQNCAMASRILSSLISAGVPLVKSLEICANTLGNFYFKEAFFVAAEKVKKGEKLSQALKPYQKFLPVTLISMIEVGEETGETGTVLSKLADFYETEVTNEAKNLASVIEPILLLLVGAAVGFFAVSMVQPMYSMLQALK